MKFEKLYKTRFEAELFNCNDIFAFRMQQETHINDNQKLSGPVPAVRRRPRLPPQNAINFDDDIEEYNEIVDKCQSIEIGV